MFHTSLGKTSEQSSNFCCGPDSKLGQTSKIKEAAGCTVIRITEQHDVTTKVPTN